MKELHRFRQYIAEGDFKNPILDKYLEIKKSIDNKTVFDYELSDFINDLDNTERKGLESDLGLERDELYEDIIKEESIPSGWKKIDTSNDYEEEERQGRLMGFEAPMSGIEGDEVDNIYIEQDGDEYEVHVMTAFNNPEYEGPFSSKEEALKVAIQKMEDLKKDWDE